MARTLVSGLELQRFLMLYSQPTVATHATSVHLFLTAAALGSR